MGIFRNKTAIVTGGGSGIGRALALELADAGARVLITDRVRKRVDEVVKELKGKGAEVAGWRVDHSRFDEVKGFCEKVLADWGGVDVLCCNAGVGHGAKIEDISIEDWEWVLGVNLWGPIYMVHLFVPQMIQRAQGWILITASGLGIMPAPGAAPYVTSKYAMVGLAESLRSELHVHNINVTALCPGVINTSIVQDGRVDLQNEKGQNAKSKVVDFYASKGVEPRIVAQDGLRALSQDIGIMPSPLHAWPLYFLHRFSPGLYSSMARYVWKKGWLI